MFEAHYSISDERETVSLTERVDFSAVGGVVAPDERLLRLLALACSTSYYKATTATTVTVGFALSAAERNFLAALIENGLTEYAYRNDRIDKLTPTIECDVVESTGTNARSWAIDGRPVVAVGGGKDSIVMLHLALKAFRPGRLPFPVMHVDTGHNFDEVIAFRDRRLGVPLRAASAATSTPA